MYARTNFAAISIRIAGRPGLIEQFFWWFRTIVIAHAIYQSVTIARPYQSACAEVRYRAWTSTFADAARIWRDTTPYDLFRGCSVSAYAPGSAIRRKIADRVPFTSDRFASTFYTCVIYINPKLSWHDGAHRSTRHDYLMDCVRIRLNTQWLNSYELWANVCVSAHVVKASIKKKQRFYKSCDVANRFFSYFPSTRSYFYLIFDLLQNAVVQ